METLKKTHPYIQKIVWVSYFICILCGCLFLIYHHNVLIVLNLFGLVICGLGHVYLSYDHKTKLKYLISHVDAIVDQKPVDIIDGEGEISLLSHKLFILSKRYYSLLEKMKQEQLQLKDYIENISHQLKTPITSMRLNEELLLETLTESQYKNKLEQIHIQTLKMNQLVNDLLTLALLDSQSLVFHFDHYAIDVLIEDVEEDLDYLLVQKEMTIQLHQHNTYIFCDKKWMEEAIKNIVKNSIDKNEKSVIDIDVTETETLLCIQIQDHGVGFLKEDIPYLFERFYRGSQKDYNGIGIGLALSKEIIEQHHGTIEARNQQGALVEIMLPKIIAKKKL